MEEEAQLAFADGAAYAGELRDGAFDGRGVFVWPGGARFEGEWRAGRMAGAGTLYLGDGASYYGGFLGGAPHGQGLYRPAPAAAAAEAAAAGGEVDVFLRTYDHGRLVGEVELRVQAGRGRRRQRAAAAAAAAAAGEAAAAAPPKPGERVFKGHLLFNLCRQLQLGLMLSVNKTRSAALLGGGRASGGGGGGGGGATLSHFFPGAGGVPPFGWKDYSGGTFRELRAAFGVGDAEYLLSLAGAEPLRALPSPGKSGSAFILSPDGRFLVKTLRRAEMATLLALVPAYAAHARARPGTALARFTGAHRVRGAAAGPALGRAARFAVMLNALPAGAGAPRLHRRYDLKGSRYRRTVGPAAAADPGATLKDLDLDMRLELPGGAHAALVAALEADCAFLEKARVMDYSLLLGVHFLAWGDALWSPPGQAWPDAAGAAAADGGAPALEGASSAEQEQEALAVALRALSPAAAGVMLGAAASSRSAAQLAASASARSPRASGPLPPVAVPLPDLGPSVARVAAAAPAAAPAAAAPPSPPLAVAAARLGASAARGARGAVHATAVRGGQREPVLIYFAIIDYLQPWSLRKRAEHAGKVLLHPGAEVSVCDPRRYARRFLAFMRDRVFAEERGG